jgi:transposase
VAQLGDAQDTKGFANLSICEDLVVLRLLADRRDELSRSRAQGLNRLHRVMTELIAGGMQVKKSVPQYQTMLAGVRPRDVVGRIVRRLAADQLADLPLWTPASRRSRPSRPRRCVPRGRT